MKKCNVRECERDDDEEEAREGVAQEERNDAGVNYYYCYFLQPNNA
jgi:hypothetical protein